VSRSIRRLVSGDADAGATPIRALALVAALGLLLVMPQTAMGNSSGVTAAPGLDDALGLTEEADCYEVTIQRNARLAEAQALVPDRYTLRSTATTARFWIINIHCASASVDGLPPVRDTTTTYVGFEVIARDGVPTSFLYLTAIATDNPLLLARYRAAGLPATLDARAQSSQSLSASGIPTVEWTFTRDDLNYSVRAEQAGPLGVTRASTTSYWFDSNRGDVRLKFENLTTAASAVRIFADFSEADAITSLLTEERFEIINGALFTGNYIRGSWTGAVELLD